MSCKKDKIGINFELVGWGGVFLDWCCLRNDEWKKNLDVGF